MSQQKSAQAPFAVFGSSKSGTTWLQRMLDAHPESSCLFQPGLMSIGPGKLTPSRSITRAKSSPFQGVFDDAADEAAYHNRLDLIRAMKFLVSRPLNGMSEPPHEETRHIHKAMVKAAVHAYLDETSTKRVKGFKQHVDIDFLVEVFPDARVIVPVRDGRDVVVSKRHHRLREGVYFVGDERWPWLTALNRLEISRRVTKLVTARSDWIRDLIVRDLSDGPLLSRAALEKSAKDWVKIIDYLMEKVDQYPNHTLLVRYEDLLERPFETMTSVFGFIDVDTSEDIVNRVIRQTSMSEMKDRDDSSFFRKGVSGEWKTVFTQENVEDFKRIAGDRLVRLGYEPDNNWTN